MPRYQVPVYSEREGVAEVVADSPKDAVRAVWDEGPEIDWIDEEWMVSEYDIVKVSDE